MFASVRARAFSPGCYRMLRCKNVCVCCPGFFRRLLYGSVFFRVSVNPSGITVPSKPCQLSQVNVVQFHGKNTHAEPIWVLQYTWGRVQKHATPLTPGDSCPMEGESHLFFKCLCKTIFLISFFNQRILL